MTLALSGFTPRHPPPTDVIVALLCERLHKLPSEVLRENAYNAIRLWNLLNEIDRIRAQNERIEREKMMRRF